MPIDVEESLLFAPHANDVHVRLEESKTFYKFEISEDNHLDLPLFNATRVTVRINSHTTSQYPSDPFSSDKSFFSTAGSSGLLVEVVFQNQTLPKDAHSSLLSIMENLAAQHYVEAPLLGSPSSHRLHRIINFDERSRTGRFMLPLEGTHALWSAQQLRHWSNIILLDADWSTWLLGNPPASLGQAQALMRDGGTSLRSVSTPMYNQLWLEWSCFDSPTGSCSRTRFRKGIQYSVSTETNSPYLNSLLPSHTEVRPGRLAEKSYLRAYNGAALSPGQNEAGIVDIPEAGLDLANVRLDIDRSSVDGAKPTWTLQTRLLRTRGQANAGTFELSMQSSVRGSPLTISIEQTFPAVLNPVWQSLQVVCDGTLTPWRYLHEQQVLFNQDGTIRLGLTQLSVHQEIHLLLNYEPAFLSVSDFPGDANRGFDFPPATAFLNETSATIFSNSHLLLSPLPDMSMPFNVISLTCTLYAFVIGSLLNLMIKKAGKQIKDKLDPDNAEPDTLIGRVIFRLKKMVTKLKDKFLPKKNEEASGEDERTSVSPTTDDTGAPLTETNGSNDVNTED